MSIANSGRISKRPILLGTSAPVQSLPSMARLYPPARQRRMGACQCGASGGLHNTAARMQRLGAGSAPPIGSPGGPDQLVAQIAQFGRRGSFVERGDDILGGASHLVNTIRQIGRVVG